MKITYVTEDTELWGGIGVIFQHLELLSEIGHTVFLTTPAGRPDWYPLNVPLHSIERLAPALIPSADVIVATSWRTIEPVVQSGKGKAVHFCQGYEAANKEYLSIKSSIDAAYSNDIPRLTISPHVDTILRERFHAETHYVGQMINREIFYPNKPLHQDNADLFTVLVAGPFEADVKNIRTTLKGISLAKSKHRIKVIRVSQLPLSEEERDIMEPDEYLLRVPFRMMGAIYRRADLLISMSKEAEGFGLPALEAMACGVPVVLSRISSYTSFDEHRDYALFTDSEPEAVSSAISSLFLDSSLRRRLVQRGLIVAGQFTKGKVADRLETAFKKILTPTCAH